MGMNLKGEAEAKALILANMSPRAKHMARLEAFVEGTQYSGMPSWFSSEAPLFERAPCIVYKIAAEAIESNCDLVLGEGRFPTLTSHPDENDAKFDDEFGLDEESSSTLDRFMAGIAKQVRFRSACRQIFKSAQGTGSGVALLGIRNRRLFVDTTKARWCTPELDANGAVRAIEIAYPYEEAYREPSGNWCVRAKLYRRVITATMDITFLPADAHADGRQPDWIADPTQTFEHNLGFCPVVWYPFMRGCGTANDFDGTAIHETELDEIYALDMALSQRHRAALYSGDPQWTEIGVEEGYNPTQKARGISVPATMNGGKPGPDNPITARYTDSPRTRATRKKGPGEVWQYDSPDVKVQLHTLPEGALKPIDEHARDLRLKLMEAMAVVLADSEHFKKGPPISGRAMEFLKGRQLDRCDQYRPDVADHLILPTMDMLLRVSKLANDRKIPLLLPGLQKVAPILGRFDVAEKVA